MPRVFSSNSLPLALACGLILSTHVRAQSVSTDRSARLDEVVVTGQRQVQLDAESESGSRLGLTVRETPATIEILSQEMFRELGLTTSVDALKMAPGVQASMPPGAPGATSMRGFSGPVISLLYDGVRLTTSSMIGRNYDTWSFERIEVLKGPASVLYGEGSIAGAINLVPKRPRFGDHAFEAMASGGSFDTYRFGFGAGGPIASTLAYRFDVSHAQSGGYIDDTDSRTTAVVGSVEFRPIETLSIGLSLDYFEDDYSTPAWGQPLVPAAVARKPTGLVRDSRGWVFDETLRHTNFNVTDGSMDSEQLWIRGNLAWELPGGLKLDAQVYNYDAKRQWDNAETYISDGTATLNRGLVSIGHDHEFYGGRMALSHDIEFDGNMRNRALLGMEYSDTDFFSPRRFSDGSGSTNTALQINAYAPVRGVYNSNPALFTGGGNRTDFTTGIKVVGLFLEEAFNPINDLLILAGIRKEKIELDRGVFDLNTTATTAFASEYEPTSWRVGAVYDIVDSVQVFAQYNKAVAPVATVLLMSNAASRFNLSDGVSSEVGVKASLLGGRLDATLSGYRITQDNILTRDPNNANITIQGGEQSSRGAELSLSYSVTDSVRLEGNLALLHAQFDRLLEAGNNNRAGNRPPNVSEQQANLWAFYQFTSIPLTLGAGARHAGAFYTNNANSIRVDGYTLYDAMATYKLDKLEFTLRGRNLSDELYADWTGASANQLIIGAPRGVELSVYTRF